jgi:hypothetical protein
MLVRSPTLNWCLYLLVTGLAGCDSCGVRLDPEEHDGYACSVDQDCAMTCLDPSSCCREPCNCTRAFNRSFIARVAERQRARCTGEQNCPSPAVCAPPASELVARCDGARCASVRVPVATDAGH